MSHDWKGKTALVTGASRGIGRALVEQLAAEGLNLLLVARDASKLEAVRANCEAHGVSARSVAADVSRAADRDALVEAAKEVDVLVNNAGIEVPVALEDQTEADIEAQIAVNLTAPILLTRALLPKLRERPRAAIVNVSSMSGKSATPYNAVYTATKHGLNGFTASLRVELQGSAVTCGVVCPGFVAGDGMWAGLGLRPPSMMKEVPLERVAKAVFRVMNGAHEVLVTPTPVRPLLALNALFPNLNGPALRWMGVMPTLEARAKRAMEGPRER